MKSILKNSVGKAERFARDEAKEVRGILGRIKRRDLKGNSGQAIKNSSYQLLRLLISKGGSIVFTILLARILMPELFGLYSLTLSTILFLGIFADLGIANSLLNFISKSLANKDYKKAKRYYEYALKIKMILLLLTLVIIFSTSYFISNTYYDKPIFMALLVGAFYIVFLSLSDHFTYVLMANNTFRPLLIREILFQTLRLVFVPITAVFLIKMSFSPLEVLAYVFLILALINLVNLISIYITLKKDTPYLKEKTRSVSSKEKRAFKKFSFPLSVITLSGFISGYIDILILGHFVLGEFIGFYSIALNLAGSLWSILSFASVAIYPIFTRLKGKVLESGFRKTRNITFVLSSLSAAFIFLLSDRLIFLIYGSDYSPAINLLRLFSLLVLLEPIIVLYTVYYMSKGKTWTLSRLLIITTILNIVLNYLFITHGLRTGMIHAVTGSAFAILISRSVYLLMLGYLRQKD